MNKDKKREVMSCMNKVKGEIVFVENDLTWEKKKVQARIGQWARLEREKERLVQIGYARVKVDGRWIR